MLREAFLVALPDLRPVTTERLVFNMPEKTFELGEVLKPDALVKLQRF